MLFLSTFPRLHVPCQLFYPLVCEGLLYLFHGLVVVLMYKVVLSLHCLLLTFKSFPNDSSRYNYCVELYQSLQFPSQLCYTFLPVVMTKGKNKRLGTGSHFFSKVAPGSLGFCRNREPLLSDQIERDIISKNTYLSQSATGLQ